MASMDVAPGITSQPGIGWGDGIALGPGKAVHGENAWMPVHERRERQHSQRQDDERDSQRPVTVFQMTIHAGLVPAQFGSDSRAGAAA